MAKEVKAFDVWISWDDVEPERTYDKKWQWIPVCFKLPSTVDTPIDETKFEFYNGGLYTMWPVEEGFEVVWLSEYSGCFIVSAEEFRNFKVEKAVLQYWGDSTYNYESNELEGLSGDISIAEYVTYPGPTRICIEFTLPQGAMCSTEYLKMWEWEDVPAEGSDPAWKQMSTNPDDDVWYFYDEHSGLVEVDFPECGRLKMTFEDGDVVISSNEYTVLPTLKNPAIQTLSDGAPCCNLLAYLEFPYGDLPYEGKERFYSVCKRIELTHADSSALSLTESYENGYRIRNMSTSMFVPKCVDGDGILALNYKLYPIYDKYPKAYTEGQLDIDVSELMNYIPTTPSFSFTNSEKLKSLFGSQYVTINSENVKASIARCTVDITKSSTTKHGGSDGIKYDVYAAGKAAYYTLDDFPKTFMYGKDCIGYNNVVNMTAIYVLHYYYSSRVKTPPITVVSYSGIDVYNLTASRLNNVEKTTTITFNCPVPELIYKGKDYNGLKSMKYRYRNVDSSTWSDWGTSGIVKGANDQYTITMDFDIAESYMFEVYVEDEVQSATETVQILQGKPLFGQSETGYFTVGGFPDDNYSDCKLQVLDSGAYVKDKVIVGDSTIKGVKDNLTTSSGGSYVLDAYQGKVLNDKITTINSNLTELSATLSDMSHIKVYGPMIRSVTAGAKSLTIVQLDVSDDITNVLNRLGCTSILGFTVTKGGYADQWQVTVTRYADNNVYAQIYSKYGSSLTANITYYMLCI